MAVCVVLLFDAPIILLGKQFNKTYKILQYISAAITYRGPY